jgi:hypothetical protein
MKTSPQAAWVEGQLHFRCARSFRQLQPLQAALKGQMQRQVLPITRDGRQEREILDRAQAPQKTWRRGTKAQMIERSSPFPRGVESQTVLGRSPD